MKRNIDGVTRSVRKKKVSENGELSSKRIKRIIENSKTNVDHLIAQTNGGNNNKDNLDKKNVIKHQGKHNYLGTKLPHSQIMHILDENFPVLCKETREIIKEEIEVILEYYLKWGEFYDEKCFKNKKFIPTKL